MVVRNAGIDWSSPGNCFWQHKVARKEAARIVLHGQSEFEASHVVLEGDQTFEVSYRHHIHPSHPNLMLVVSSAFHMEADLVTWSSR